MSAAEKAEYLAAMEGGGMTAEARSAMVKRMAGMSKEDRAKAVRACVRRRPVACVRACVRSSNDARACVPAVVRVACGAVRAGVVNSVQCCNSAMRVAPCRTIQGRP